MIRADPLPWSLMRGTTSEAFQPVQHSTTPYPHERDSTKATTGNEQPQRVQIHDKWSWRRCERLYCGGGQATERLARDRKKVGNERHTAGAGARRSTLGAGLLRLSQVQVLIHRGSTNCGLSLGIVTGNCSHRHLRHPRQLDCCSVGHSTSSSSSSSTPTTTTPSFLQWR